MGGERGGHSAALDEAWDKLARTDLQTVASNSGAVAGPEPGTLKLRIVDEDCLIDLSKRTVVYSGRRTEKVSEHLQILVLHYLLGAGNAQVANRPATYREFEGGALYYSAFKSRTIDPLVREFGVKPDLLKHVGDAIRAEPLKMGSVGFRVNFFPKIPVTVILWLGDDEVPASANMLFDANAGRIMPTEDLSVLGGELVKRLVTLSRV